MDAIFNIIGIIGVVQILLGYFLITRGTLTGENMSYHLLNLVGAIMLLISLMWAWNLPSVIIEFCWMAISLYGIIKILKKKK